jgi:hypothetical protein
VSLGEVLVASAVTMSVMAGVVAALGSAQAAFVAQSEAADLRQRVRVGLDAITRDLLAATEALPFPGGILIVSGSRQGTYYTRAGTLRRDDGDGTDLPVVDGVREVEFEWVGKRVRARLRMLGTRRARDTEIVFEVGPRNMSHAPPG